MFNNKDRTYLLVTSSGTHWVASKTFSDCLYDTQAVKIALKILIDNSYFCVGDQVFRQKIGISIGVDPAPYLANICLGYYEVHWIKKLKREDYDTAKKYMNNYRFFDFLSSLKDDGEFERSHSEIYAEELECTKRE